MEDSETCGAVASAESWDGSMPEDVVELILKRLPPRSLVRFRAVCKRWYALISHPTLHADNELCPPLAEPWMLMLSQDRTASSSLINSSSSSSPRSLLHAYIPSLRRWHTLHLPKKVCASFPFLEAAGGNLVCLSDDDSAGGQLSSSKENGALTRVLVCNPLMKTWQELPPLQAGVKIRCIGVDPETKAFRILATYTSTPNAEDHEHHWQSAQTFVQVYDSEFDGWRLISAPVPAMATGATPICCNSRFYFLGSNFHLFGLDLEQEVWIEVHTNSLPLGIGVSCEDRKLVESDGHFILFTAEVDLYGKREFTIWLLNEELQWEPAARPPWSISSQFLNASSKSFSVLATQSGSSIFLKNMQSSRVAHLELNFVHGEGRWMWLPDLHIPSNTLLLQPFWI
ncbi:unnamed protein product [Sphagnum troendelagicum]|uniref:F-box domain-containing protein n=1 Tax=Sphagnum troendelagicum TaxID=128251 RepID=A0ABP0UBY5_9BRYO